MIKTFKHRQKPDKEMKQSQSLGHDSSNITDTLVNKNSGETSKNISDLVASKPRSADDSALLAVSKLGNNRNSNTKIQDTDQETGSTINSEGHSMTDFASVAPSPVSPSSKPLLTRHYSHGDEPKSLSYMHKLRYSDKKLFLLTSSRQSETKDNTEQNRGTGENSLAHSRKSSVNSFDDNSIGSPSTSDFPPLVRKKTGEIVKSSLKLSALSRSLPSTPTYKSVHFNNQSLADVRYFDEKDTPNALSVEGSPITKPKYKWLIGDSDDDSSGYSDEEDEDNFDDLEIEMTNFQTINYKAKLKSQPMVFLERVFLSVDKKFMKGNIAVRNIAFEKKVLFSYSTNNWKTTSQVEASYLPDIPRMLRKELYDRFTFKIPIVTLLDKGNQIDVYVKYETGGQSFWDNNQSRNYRVLLHRKDEDLNSLSRDPSKLTKFRLDVGEDLEASPIYTKFDSYFPPFESFLPNPSSFKYDSPASLQAKSPDFRGLGETYGFGNFYSNLEETNTIENLAFDAPTVISPKVSRAAKTPMSPNDVLKSPDAKIDLDKVRDERPSTDSKSYKELLESYCFYQG